MYHVPGLSSKDSLIEHIHENHISATYNHGKISSFSFPYLNFQSIFCEPILITLKEEQLLNNQITLTRAHFDPFYFTTAWGV